MSKNSEDMTDHMNESGNLNFAMAFLKEFIDINSRQLSVQKSSHSKGKRENGHSEMQFNFNDDNPLLKPLPLLEQGIA